jgi:hypothetical protein
MCYFAGSQGMVTRRQSQGIQDHLRELHLRIEQLAKTDAPSQAPGLVGHSHKSNLSGLEQAQPTEVDQDYPGTLKIDQGGTRYVNPTHWQSILDEVIYLFIFNFGLRLPTDMR